MKENKAFLFLIISLCLLFLFPLLKTPFYKSHDGEAHVARFAAYYKAYSDGQFPARWAGDLNYGFGSPVFIFYYPLPGTFASLMHVLGIGFEDAFKALISLSFILSGVSFYFWISKHVRKEAAVLGTLLYALAPYHFLNTYVRGDVAEMMALSIVPFVFLFIDLTLEKPRIQTIVLGGLFYSLLILSHNAISLMFSPIFLFYIILKTWKKKGIFPSLGIILIGLMLSAFFWVPALFEAKYTNANLFIGDMFKNNFVSLSALFYSSWGFGPDVNTVGGLSAQIGPLHVSLALAGSLLFYIRKKIDRTMLFWICTFVLSILMTLSISTPIWEHTPLLRFFQFPWRFTALASFSAASFAALFFNNVFDKRLIRITSLVLLIISIPMITIKESITRPNEYYNSYSGTTDYHGQASTIWTAGDPGVAAKQKIEIIDGDAIISEVKKKSNNHSFTIEAKTDARILDNTIYFPGWQAEIDGQKVPIEFQDINHRGLITFSVPQGIHTIEVVFGESPIRFVSNMISLVSIVVIAGLVLLRKRADKLLGLIWERVFFIFF